MKKQLVSFFVETLKLSLWYLAMSLIVVLIARGLVARGFMDLVARGFMVLAASSQKAIVMIPVGLLGEQQTEPITLEAVCEESRTFAPDLECRAVAIAE